MIEDADRETAAAIRVALYRAFPDMPSYDCGIIEPYLERHRQQAEDAMWQRCFTAVSEAFVILSLSPGLADGASKAFTACEEAVAAIRATPPKPDRLNGEGE